MSRMQQGNATTRKIESDNNWFILVVVTVCKQINNESSLLPKATLWDSSVFLTCLLCNEHAALQNYLGPLSCQTAPVSSASQTLSIFQFSSCEKWDEGRNRVMDQARGRLKKCMGFISVYLSGSKHGRPMMKSRMGGKNETELNRFKNVNKGLIHILQIKQKTVVKAGNSGF